MTLTRDDNSVVVSTGSLPAVEWEVPLANPSAPGLYAVTIWTDTALDAPSRFLGLGVRFRVHNYGGEQAFGVWESEWCVDPDDQVKHGVRPEFLDPFTPITVWAYDECDLTLQSTLDIESRALQNLRLLEQIAVERELAQRLLIDADTYDSGSSLGLYEPPFPSPSGDHLYEPYTTTTDPKLYPRAAGNIVDVPDIVAAVSRVEAQLAMTNTYGVIHAGAQWAAYAARYNLIVRSGTSLKTPSGHTWAFGGGYVKGLENVIVGTSPTYGWRDQVQYREAIDPFRSLRIGIAERSLLVGYEHCTGGVRIASYCQCA